MKKIIIFIIHIYQKFSLLIPNKCRLVPSCSNYFIEAVENFGVFKGSVLGIKRIFKCNHFSKLSYDPVPLNIVGEYKWLL